MRADLCACNANPLVNSPKNEGPELLDPAAWPRPEADDAPHRSDLFQVFEYSTNTASGEPSPTPGDRPASESAGVRRRIAYRYRLADLM